MLSLVRAYALSKGEALVVCVLSCEQLGMSVAPLISLSLLLYSSSKQHDTLL